MLERIRFNDQPKSGKIRCINKLKSKRIGIFKQCNLEKGFANMAIIFNTIFFEEYVMILIWYD